MAYGNSHFFPGGTKGQYEAVMIAMNGKLGVIPEGQIFHVAGPAPGGWRILAVHDDKESWDKFFSGTFIPLMKKGIPAGFTAPPDEISWDVTHFYK